MRFLRSRAWRIFLIAWMLFSVHFATNVVREHYPAFSLVAHGTFKVDEYQGFHSDIFVHRGHSVIGNQVFVSLLAAVPLFVFNPVLDALEAYSKKQLLEHGVQDAEYRTHRTMLIGYFRLVKERGLDLRFGGATVVTSVFFMAPLAALFVVFMYRIFLLRGVDPGQATSLALLFGFATPIFYRASVLGHNMFLMYAMFLSFFLLWVRPGMPSPLPLGRRIAAGVFGGLTLAIDYMAVVILPILYGYLVLTRLQTASLKQALRESLPFIAGTIPPILFLWYSQWSMYGNPFMPGQYWMPDQNVYVQLGARGFLLPQPDLILRNLFDPGYGLYLWAPILALGLIPVHRYPAETLILPTRERWFVIVSFVAILLFSSANQYARLQWNSGFRYLLPLVPFIFLAVSDHWIRLPRWARISIGSVALVNSWVLTVFRERFLQESWADLFREGIQLPWLRVLRMTSRPDLPLVNGQALPAAILAVTLVAAYAIWRYGAMLESREPSGVPLSGTVAGAAHP